MSTMEGSIGVTVNRLNDLQTYSMSESSFDTSAANTAASLASGHSLGQCIKLTAEESQGKQWFELCPTFEKEWHTLQGEPSSQITIEDEMSELPSHVATGKKIQDVSNSEVHVEKNDCQIEERPLTVDQLSNILEKDDSLAQRVQNLLDYSCEVKSLEDNDHINSNNNNDHTTPRSCEKLITTKTDKTSSEFKPEAVDKSSLTSGQRLPEMLKQPVPQSDTDMYKIISQLSEKSDPFGSLNTSKSTEYGDLPETVDIPPDIIKRLNTMRLLDKSSASPKEAWVPSSLVGISGPSYKDFSTAKNLQNEGIKSKASNEAPISGNVQYHFGSNPTTPQFPFDECNLKQLQTYIEKKSGEPSISPLVVGSEIVVGDTSNSSPFVNPNHVTSVEGDISQPKLSPTSIPLSVETICPQNPIQPTTTNLVVGETERIEPEGMSPPVVSSAGTLLSSGNLSRDRGTKSLSETSQHPCSLPFDSGNMLLTTEEKASSSKSRSSSKGKNLDESLADESILARIKSVLSESMSKPQVGSSLCEPTNAGLGRSDASFASSIDSLAVQVKALLQEEIDQQLESKHDHDVNLSAVIENFEQTDLWKYVCQFLPPVETDATEGCRNFEEDEKDDANQSEISLNNTLLERIRSEFNKEKAAMQQAALSTVQTATTSTTATQNGCSYPNLEHNTIDPFDPSKISFPKSLETQSVKSLNSGYKEVKSPVSCPSKHSYKISEKSHAETIPGIPDFSRSVFSSTEGDQPRPKLPDVRNAESPIVEKSGFKLKVHEVQQRTVDHKFLHKDLERQKELKIICPKDQDIRISSFRTEESSSSHSAQNADSFGDAQSFRKGEAQIIPNQFVSPNKEKVHQNKEYNNPNYCRGRDATQPGKVPESRYSSTPVKHHFSQHVAFQPSTGISFLHVSPNSSSKKSPIKGQTAQGSELQHKNYKSPLRKSQQNRKSPKKVILQNRPTVFDWLSSPERKQYKGKEKLLPTFNELMMEQEKQMVKQVHDEQELDLIPTSDKEMPKCPSSDGAPSESVQSTPTEEPTNMTSVKTALESKTTKSQPIPEKKQASGTLHLHGPPSSLCLEVEENDSYQNLSMSVNQMPSIPSESLHESKLSDVEMHRRMLNNLPSSRSTDDRDALTSKSSTNLLSSLDDFHTLDVNVQKQILKKLVALLQSKKKSDLSSHSAQKPRKGVSRPVHVYPSRNVLHETSQNSNAAVCDSDSTEYCELPSSRQTSLVKDDNSVRKVFGVDESKAEQIMKRLLRKIEKQKVDERWKSGRKIEKRAASSSTPEKVHAPLIVPEASSIASTDTDASRAVQYVHMKRHAPARKKKITYVEEVSSSEPTIVKVKRRHRKPDFVTTRVVLHDRSVQANIEEETSALSHDIATNFPSPVVSKAKPKRSKSVQTRRLKENKENVLLDDTITLDSTAKEMQTSTRQGSTPKETQRFSSFYVDFTKEKKNVPEPQEKMPFQKSLAWYEPFSYQPPWMDMHEVENANREGLVRITLQEALSGNLPNFVSKSRERQRKIAINAEERRLQEVWAEERQRVFGAKTDNTRKPLSYPPFKRRVELTRRQVIEETREKYQQLPEVVKRKKEEERRRQYATNRLKANLYKKKIQNKVLGKYFIE